MNHWAVSEPNTIVVSKNWVPTPLHDVAACGANDGELVCTQHELSCPACLLWVMGVMTVARFTTEADTWQCTCDGCVRSH